MVTLICFESHVHVASDINKSLLSSHYAGPANMLLKIAIYSIYFFILYVKIVKIEKRQKC